TYANAGNNVPTPSPANLNPTTITSSSIPPVSAGGADATVFGYEQNALIMRMPGQPQPHALRFANMMHANFANTSFTMPAANFPCMGFSIFFTEICIGRWIGEIIYNGIVVLLMQTIGNFLASVAYNLVMMFMMIPLAAMSAIFTQSIKTLSEPGLN